MERLMKATPKVLGTVDLIELILKRVINMEDSNIISTDSGRGFTVVFKVNNSEYQIVVDTDSDIVEFGVIKDCRYIFTRECVSSSKSFQVFNIIKDVYAKKELTNLFEHFYMKRYNK